MDTLCITVLLCLFFLLPIHVYNTLSERPQRPGRDETTQMVKSSWIFDIVCFRRAPAVWYFRNSRAEATVDVHCVIVLFCFFVIFPHAGMWRFLEDLVSSTLPKWRRTRTSHTVRCAAWPTFLRSLLIPSSVKVA